MFRSGKTVRAVLVTSLAVAVVGGAVRAAGDRGPMLPPQSVPWCVAVAIPGGESDWYCGEVIRIPQGAQVIERGLTPCANEDGSGGPLPCRWDARTRGTHRGSSFTVLPDGDPVGGVQHVLYRYDHGVTMQGTVQS